MLATAFKKSLAPETDSFALHSIGVGPDIKKMVVRLEKFPVDFFRKKNERTGEWKYMSCDVIEIERKREKIMNRYVRKKKF